MNPRKAMPAMDRNIPLNPIRGVNAPAINGPITPPIPRLVLNRPNIVPCLSIGVRSPM